MFNDAVLDHFRNPHNAGELPDATATVEVTNPVCGDVLRLAVRVESGRIAAARFKTQGCVAAIAASSVLTDLLSGKTIGEARTITPEQISNVLWRASARVISRCAALHGCGCRACSKSFRVAACAEC